LADLLALSSRIIDAGVADEPVNRVTQQLSELADDFSIVESFSHVVTLRTGEGLVVFDTSLRQTAPAVIAALRKWSPAPFHSLVYTHGHMDHVGGAPLFVAEAAGRGHARPRVLGHENVAARFARYRTTSGYNLAINARQFGDLRGMMAGVAIGGGEAFLPADTPAPDASFGDRMRIDVGGVAIELRHAKGETDDHLFAWIPARRILCAGDFFIWNFPNAGNPQKVQRYPVEWAAALREMAGLGAELFVPAHGLPIEGAARIARVLGEVAGALEQLVSRTLERMNAGEPLDRILAAVTLDAELLARPYLRPLYDEPEFVVRNVYRLYGGWYDGNPANLKPAPESELARELCDLAGGAASLAARAQALAERDEWRLACHLIEIAARAVPEDRAVHGVRAEIYRARRKRETSLMAKGIFGHAARRSEAIASGDRSRDA
jgi:alkyl sulfatase BDS1-like metallo-beta-lactamase superfamily hydrolase